MKKFMEPEVEVLEMVDVVTASGTCKEGVQVDCPAKNPAVD